MSETVTDDIDLESQEFREALLSRLNGQTEDMQRLIKLVDTRFQTYARRLREHRSDHAAESQKLTQKVADEAKAVAQKVTDESARARRLAGAVLTIAPAIAVGILKAWEAVT